MSRIARALEKSKKSREAVLARVDGSASGKKDDSLLARAGKDGQTLARFILNAASLGPSSYKRNRVVLGEVASGAKSAYNVLRTRVLQRLRTNGWNRLAISSPGPAEGKTLTAINLAISMARQAQQRVVLVDFDLQRPTVERYLDIHDVECHLDDYLSGRAKPENILYSTPIENLWVIPNRRPIQNSSEVLASEEISKLLTWIESVDPNCILLIDLPPILLSDDVLTVSPMVHALLLVMAEGNTTRESARNTRELIEDQNIELMGTVLNKSSDKMAVYKY